MSFLSCEEMLAAARSQKITLAEAVLRSDLDESRLTEEQSRAAMHHLWQVMQATSREYDPAQRSRSGLSGGDAAKVEQAHKEGKLLGGDYLSAVTAEALKTAECNACMKRGTPEQGAAAAAMALGNLLGLVCDPVAGLVEVPCVKRNVVGAVNAVSCANMALAGVDYAIPCDEVIDAMGRVGSLLSPDLRETGQGGLAATPTGVKIAQRLAQEG